MLDKTRTYTAEQVQRLLEAVSSEAFGIGQANMCDYSTYAEHHGLKDGRWQDESPVLTNQELKARVELISQLVNGKNPDQGKNIMTVQQVMEAQLGKAIPTRGPMVIINEEAPVTPELIQRIKMHIDHQQRHGPNTVDKSRDQERIDELWNEYGDRDAVPMNSDLVERVMFRREFDIVMKLPV